MEHKQFTPDNLQENSPHSDQGFQADRFVKKTINLNIPDTIPENSSAESSRDSLKMEAPKIKIPSFNGENKESISSNHPVTSEESINTSIITTINNSYIRQCERKLLESSDSDNEKSIENISVVDRHLLEFPRLSAHLNDTISTPPSVLKKEISLLRSEMAEVHEFHDFEIQVLKEEKFQHEADSYNYPEIISKMTEKYSALMDLYTNLKTEYEDYRNEQEQMRQEIQSKAADCLESLCSQIETSDNSLNFSGTSFVSFSGGVKSSTMMEDISEVEATVLHDATVLANDPLSITNDGVFKTPMHTPLKSAKKLFLREINSTSGKPIMREVKDIMSKRDTTIPLDSEYSMQLLNVETALYDKVKEIEDIEQRLFKVEDLSLVLQSELERVKSENNTLQESVVKKSEELNELTRKLFTETISLNPSLKDSLLDISPTKILIVFIETIMESCKKIQNEEITKHNSEKAEWEARIKADSTLIENLQNQLDELYNFRCYSEKKLSETENAMRTRDEEILMLQTQLSNAKQTREEAALVRETLSELESRLTLTEAEKAAAENCCRDLERIAENLKREIEISRNIQTKLEDEKLAMKSEIESKNQIELELTTMKENLTSAEEMIEKLKSQLESVESIKSNLEKCCTEFSDKNEIFRIENEDLKQRISEFEKLSEELKTELELRKEEEMSNTTKMGDILKEIELLKKHNIDVFDFIEETRKNLTDLLVSGFESKNEFLSEKIAECVKNMPIIQDSKIISIFIETVTKTCESVEKELLKKFETDKLEWENEKNDGLRKIHDEISSLTERSNQEKEKMNLEMKDLLKSQESLLNRITEAEIIISDCREEMKIRDAAHKQTENKLAMAGETIAELKSQLSSIQMQKEETESRCRNLEGTQVEVTTIMKELDELKNLQEGTENENLSLKEEVLKLKEVIRGLEENLGEVKEEESRSEAKIRDLLVEMESLKQQQENLTELSERMETNNKNLVEVLGDLQSSMNIPKDTLAELLIGNFENKKIFTYRINALIKAQVDELKSRNETLFDEKRQEEELRRSREEELEKTQDLARTRENEIDSLKGEIEKVKSQLRFAVEAEKMEAYTRCHELEEVVNTLKEELATKEKEKTELVLLVEEKKLEAVRLEEELMTKHNEESLKEKENRCEVLESKLKSTEKLIVDREETIELLKRDLEEIRKEHEEQKNKLEATEKLRWELARVIEKLKEEMETMENLRTRELTTQKSEMIELKESYDELKTRVTEAENVIMSREEEIRVLRSYQTELNTCKQNLESADETILVLKSQLKSIEVEKSQMENRCTLQLQISNKSLENYEKIQTENDDLKQRIFDSEKMMMDLKNELNAAREDQMNNMSKVEELVREIEELKKENNGFSLALFTIEETQRNLVDVLSEDANDSDLPGDRISKFMAKATNPAHTKETKIVSDFVETITKTCKGVQNELIKKFDNKKLEWESQKDVDLQSLHDQIKILNAQHECVLAEIKNELALAGETILKLKSELSSAQIDKVETELKCRKLEECLQSETDTKDTIIRGLDELKTLREKTENENRCLKRQMQESEDVLVLLKKRLKTTEEEQQEKEAKMQNLLEEIDSLKKEKECLDFVAEKLEKVEKRNRNLMEALSDLQTHLDIPDDTLTKFLTGDCENRKIFSERINAFAKTQMEGLKDENRNLKLGNENLKKEIKELTKLMGETASNELRNELSNLNVSQPNKVSSKTKASKNIDLCVRRLDKLEEINHNLSELLTRVLTMTEFPDLEKIKLCSVREFPSLTKKVVAHVTGLLEKIKEMKEQNGELDEECETYANIIKELKKEAATVWKDNKDKTEAMEVEIERLKEEKNSLEKEKEDLLAKISKLNDECLKLKSKTEGTLYNCNCGSESKKINELKRTILVKEQKLLELQDLEGQVSSYKSQIEYLKTALEREKKKIGEEREKNKKLQNELNEAAKHQKTEKSDENRVLDELRMRGSISGGLVQEIVEKEKMRKLSKDIGILKELCRARYAEIKRLEAVNAALRNSTPKNSNQMDSPIRSRAYNTRSKNQMRDFWKTEISGKENSDS